MTREPSVTWIGWRPKDSERERLEGGFGEHWQVTVWQRVFPIWDIFFSVVLVLTFVNITLAPRNLPSDKTTALILVGALGLWYVLLGRSAIGTTGPRWRGGVYVIGIIVLYVPAVTAVLDASSILFVLGPQLFLSVRLGWAVVMILLLDLTAVAGLVLDGEQWEHVVMYTIFALIFAFYALAFGIWLDRAAVESAERERLIEQLESSRAEVARLSHEAGVAAERERLAGEIHDTLAQGFTSIVTLVQAAESEMDSQADGDLARRHLTLAVRTARENLDEARALVGALTPAPLTNSSLVGAISRLVERVGHDLGIATECVVTGEPRQLATDIEVMLLRATQEALNNVRKHAGAGAVAVSVEFTEEAVLLRIADDGAGFDPERMPMGFGLPGLRSRTEQVGGAFAVNSAPGKGTVVKVAVPV
ncbi:sensor histidine kinase [Allokutzneria albata]|uniref:Oxygen sensor histidine kinase NreB n=1 Tax=Allokutzneria albata TaxID=211114 RepID=A0A1H0AZ78_ALLAB|nr:sensor histidine kinase [Allokutzneria albata]SDN38738.1 Signal transduction histidine kinase [Allokutzneria albata]